MAVGFGKRLILDGLSRPDLMLLQHWIRTINLLSVLSFLASPYICCYLYFKTARWALCAIWFVSWHSDTDIWTLGRDPTSQMIFEETPASKFMKFSSRIPFQISAASFQSLFIFENHSSDHSSDHSPDLSSFYFTLVTNPISVMLKNPS